MPSRKLRAEERKIIDDAVKHFDEHRHLFDGFAKSVMESLRTDEELAPYIHFIKYRLKSPERLRAKLTKKCMEADRRRPEIDSANLFQKINDLAGVRILHLHTSQIDAINKCIQRILRKVQIRIVEGPIAHCWDVEYENIFKAMGIETESRDSMYTSVHYVLEANEKTKITFELQVRTLTEELWAEVSHRVEYEEHDPDEKIQAQLKVLARLTSGSTRLVDCIFDAFEKT